MITIKTTRSHAVHEWMMKEYGSWEDHNKDVNHACASLQRFGGNVKLTREQAEELIKSGEYQSTGWNDDEISGGARTKQVIARYVRLIKSEMSK